MLLDGTPLNDPGGDVNLGQLQSAAIDRIEVVRGPESALFGSEAAAGVVQLFARRGDPERRVPHGGCRPSAGIFRPTAGPPTSPADRATGWTTR